MSKTILVTVSDDRFGRKQGGYRTTQDKIENLFLKQGNFGLHDYHYKYDNDILGTEFYYQNKTMLDNLDPARNGRLYKPYVVKKALDGLNFGDFLIYNDCSPELWNIDVINRYIFDINIIKDLCVNNNDILTAFVKWSNKDLGKDDLGLHTHKNFTLDRCINFMGMQAYRNSFMCASGMIVIRKTPKTEELINEWLYWNRIEDCSCLGKCNIPDDYSFWREEEYFKMGHRHDQSILSLLLNRMNQDFVEIDYTESSLHPYNFLQFCRIDRNYAFINGNTKAPINFELEVGDICMNDKGIELIVFEVREPNSEKEILIVGKVPAAAYGSKRNNLKLIKKCG